MPQRLFLLLALLFIRLPFFFRDYIDHDESTFIIMGASVADGYLPYEHLWDLKSPFLFYVFALIEYLFPDSFIAIRLFGLIVIYFSALLLMKIADASKLRNGFLVALGYVILSSLFGSLQGVMSEHLAVLFILIVLYFLTHPIGKITPLLLGFFMGFALLCKLNYAYAALAFFSYLLFVEWKRSTLLQTMGWALLVVAGVILPFLLVAVPFVLENKFQLYFDSTFLAPFSYGHAGGHSLLFKLTKTWWIILAGIVINFFAWKRWSPGQRIFVHSCILLLLGTIFSFLTSGKVNGHYLIEVYPFILLLILGILFRKNYIPSIGLTALVVLLLSFESWKEYLRVGNNIAERSTPFNGKSYLVIDELKKRGIEREPIFFIDYHISYWLLDQYPLTRSTTHPSNLGRPYLFKYFGNEHSNTLAELSFIMEEIQPQAVVSRKPFVSFLPPEGPENKFFISFIQTHYNLVVEDSKNGIYIWQRKKESLR